MTTQTTLEPTAKPQHHWDLTILDADPESANLVSLDVADLDNDGKLEVIVSGHSGNPDDKDRALLWYRPDTFEQGVVAKGLFHVGLTAHDIDGDGNKEILTSYLESDNRYTLVYFKMGDGPDDEWTKHTVDDNCNGGAHDLVFADLDGDGEDELIVNAAYCEVPGVFIYKKGDDPAQPWQKHAVLTGVFAEGLAAGDLDGDGRLELVHGPYWLKAPEAGPFSGPWGYESFAPNLREMCRVALLDVTGSGRSDIFIVDSEYMDGRLSLFENRSQENPEEPWKEHVLETPVVFAHSLTAWREDGSSHVFLGEMAQGGWDPPYNYDARLLLYQTDDNGKSWQRETVAQGQGTHEAQMVDIDGDGVREVVGKETWRPRLHIWKRREGETPFSNYRHRFVDRDKAMTGTDIVALDVNGDGKEDILCAKWWYKNPSWEKFEIPGIYQVITAYDIDRDGRLELIASKKAADATDNWYTGLSSELVWLKAIDPEAGKWEEHAIGKGSGDWPHGNAVAPLLPGGKLALICSYHSAHAGDGHVPELFEVPDDPTQPWSMRVLADIKYGEEMIPYDLTGDGTLDIVAGTHWLENLGDGTFEAHKLIDDDDFYPARLRVLDVDDDGKPEVVMGQEKMDYPTQYLPFSLLSYFKPGDDIRQPWTMHAIDKVRCAHSIEAADLDGDGELELVVGEHDPFNPYRHRARLYVYKKASKEASAWRRYTLPGEYEHHDGTKLIELEEGKYGIMSHGWKDNIYVHLWEHT